MIIIEWINLIKYQMLAKNSDIIATLRWVRLVHKCQIVKFWKQIESIRAFMRECAWRYAPASDHSKVVPTSMLVLNINTRKMIDNWFWINLINYQSCCANYWYNKRVLRWVRLYIRCQIVKYWKQIESIRAFMRECAWRYAPASVGIDVQVGPTSILVLNCIFANIWYLILLIQSIIIILRILQFYI